MGQRIRYVNYQRLAEEPDIGLALAWIIAGQDLYLAMCLERELTEQASDKRISEFTSGGRFYMLRLMCAQASEAIRLVEPSVSSELIQRLVQKHDWAESAFSRLKKMHEEGQGNADMALLMRIRNKGTFHYFDWRKQEQKIPSWLKDGLEEAIADGTTVGSFVMDDKLFTRFLAADEAFASMFAKEILQAAKHAGEYKQETVRESAKLLARICDDVASVAQSLAFGLALEYPAR